MKLLLVTTVTEYQKTVIKFFREAGIQAFSSSEIDGFKTTDNQSSRHTYNWFAAESGAADSLMFFSFTDEANIDAFFSLAQKFNETDNNFNPIRAVVVPIERTLN